ncbi:MAG TPA: cupin domain-containing protein, partial [Thermoanaerobaculia bacterium]
MDPAHFEEAYGILVQEVYPWAEAAATPFGAVWAIVEPGKRTKHHNHQEGETFFVASGQGRYRVGDEVVEVKAGDVVFQPPFNSHVIENTSESENLVFLS